MGSSHPPYTLAAPGKSRPGSALQPCYLATMSVALPAADINKNDSYLTEAMNLGDTYLPSRTAPCTLPHPVAAMWLPLPPHSNEGVNGEGAGGTKGKKKRIRVRNTINQSLKVVSLLYPQSSPQSTCSHPVFQGSRATLL